MPIAAAAAVVLVSLSVLVGVNLIRRSRDAHVAALNSGPTQTASEPPSSTSLDQSIPSPPVESAFRLEKAQVRLPASAVILWRGEAGAGNSPLKELERALAPYRTDNYSEAEPRLEAVARKYPRLAEARYYLGVCQLFLNNNQEAAANLKIARNLAQKELATDAEWYLALAYHKSQRDGDARPLLEELCHAAGKDSTRSCAALGELSTKQ